MDTYRFICVRGDHSFCHSYGYRKRSAAAGNSHIKQQGLSSRIRTRLSDGLTALQPGEADTILIAGMGGGLVMKILSRHTMTLTGSEELILQPQSEIAQVRAYLRTHGFRILEEEMILEDGKYYPMMKVVQETASDQREETVQVQVEDGLWSCINYRKTSGARKNGCSGNCRPWIRSAISLQRSRRMSGLRSVWRRYRKKDN